MLPWLAVLAILLFDPIGLMGILRAAELLSLCGIAYTVAFVVVSRHVPGI